MAEFAYKITKFTDANSRELLPAEIIQEGDYVIQVIRYSGQESNEFFWRQVTDVLIGLPLDQNSYGDIRRPFSAPHSPDKGRDLTARAQKYAENISANLQFTLIRNAGQIQDSQAENLLNKVNILAGILLDILCKERKHKHQPYVPVPDNPELALPTEDPDKRWMAPI